MSAPDEKVWQTTAVQNLVRYAPSGTYFARFRVSGKLVWKSLKTATFSVAKQRLPDTLRDHRSKIESFTAFADGKMTVGDAAEVYLNKVRASASLKPRSKDYRLPSSRRYLPRDSGRRKRLSTQGCAAGRLDGLHSPCAYPAVSDACRAELRRYPAY